MDTAHRPAPGGRQQLPGHLRRVGTPRLILRIQRGSLQKASARVVTRVLGPLSPPLDPSHLFYTVLWWDLRGPVLRLLRLSSEDVRVFEGICVFE